jgi:RNA polymerase sigma factor (sigma-70 family)
VLGHSLHAMALARGSPVDWALADQGGRSLRPQVPALRSPRAWVRRAAFTIYVRHATRLRREQAALAQAVSVTSRASVAEANYKEGQWRIVAIMRQLPPEQRKVAALFYDGLTQYEIAEVIGKPVATVRSLLRHARIRLKEVIQSQGLDSPDGAS